MNCVTKYVETRKDIITTIVASTTNIKVVWRSRFWIILVLLVIMILTDPLGPRPHALPIPHVLLRRPALHVACADL